MYATAVDNLARSAAQTSGLRDEMRALADGLAGGRWGATLVSLFHDADPLLTDVERAYLALAGEMKLQGDQGAAAQAAAPWTPESVWGAGSGDGQLAGRTMPALAGGDGGQPAGCTMPALAGGDGGQPAGTTAPASVASGGGSADSKSTDVLDLCEDYEAGPWSDSFVEQACVGLAGLEFDTLVGTGVSGSAAVPVLAKALGVNFVLVRKPQERAQSFTANLVAGRMGRRWLLVDDFMDSGGTVRRVKRAIDKEVSGKGWDTTFVGVYLYHGQDDEYESNPEFVVAEELQRTWDHEQAAREADEDSADDGEMLDRWELPIVGAGQLEMKIWPAFARLKVADQRSAEVTLWPTEVTKLTRGVTQGLVKNQPFDMFTKDGGWLRIGRVGDHHELELIVAGVTHKLSLTDAEVRDLHLRWSATAIELATDED